MTSPLNNALHPPSLRPSPQLPAAVVFSPRERAQRIAVVRALQQPSVGASSGDGALEEDAVEDDPRDRERALAVMRALQQPAAGASLQDREQVLAAVIRKDLPNGAPKRIRRMRCGRQVAGLGR